MICNGKVRDGVVANSLMLLLIESGMSLMYMRNRQGPSTDPRGTPDNTGQEPDCSLSRTTLCDLPDKKDLIHVHRLREKKIEHNIVNIFLSINFNICFGCSKNRIETVLLSTHNTLLG